jgi:hypothetical protein
MKTKHFLSVMFILIALLACNRTKKVVSNDEIIRLPTSFEKGDFSLSEIASDLIFIPLSTDVPIPTIRRIECFDSTIYIYGTQQTNSMIFRFKFDGSYIDVLDKKGRGPDEYMAVNDFHVDKKGTIYVNCGTTKKILLYNNDLTYKTTIPYPKDVNRSFVRWLDSTIIFFPNEMEEAIKHDWVETNYKGEIVNAKMDDCYDRSFYAGTSLLLFKNDSIIFRYRTWSDTIYAISSNGSSAKYVFERLFEDGLRMNSLDEIFFLPIGYAQYDAWSNHAGKRNINAIHDIGNKLIISYKGEKMESVLFDPINNKSRIILDDNKGLARIPNDWSGSGDIEIRNIVKVGSDRYIVDFIEAIKVKSMVQTDSFLKGESTKPEKKNEFQMLGDKLSENDNPVLVLVKLR